MFLEKMKLLLFYFVEFEENGKILPKKYLNDYAVGGPDWQPIIMIKYDKGIFSINDSQ